MGTNVLTKVMKMNEYEKIASRYLFTDMAIKNLELDRQHLENSPCKIKDPYFKLFDQLISTAIKERKRLKQLMYQHKLQVERVASDRLFTTYKYYLNGYVHEVNFFNHMIKKYVEGIMKEIFSSIMNRKNPPTQSEQKPSEQ